MAESRFRSLFSLLINCLLLVIGNASPETDLLCNVSTPAKLSDFAAVLANCYDECTSSMIPIFEKSEGYADLETTSTALKLAQTKLSAHGNVQKEEEILNGKRKEHQSHADTNPMSKTTIVSDVIDFGKTSEELGNALLQNIEQLESYTYDCNTNQATAIFRNVPTPSKLGDYSAMLADRYDECSSSMIPYYCEESEGEADFETIPSAKTESHGDIHKEEETLNQKHAEHLHHENANPTYQTNIGSGAIHFGKASEGPENALLPDCAGLDPITGDLTTNQAIPILSNVAIYSAMLADSYDECSSSMIPYYCEESEGDAGYEPTRTTLGLAQTVYEVHGNIQKEILNEKREEYLRHADANPLSKTNITSEVIDFGKTSEQQPRDALLPDREQMEPYTCDSKTNQASDLGNLEENVEDPVLDSETADSMRGRYNAQVCICYLPTTEVPEARKDAVITQTKLWANGLEVPAKELNAEEAEMDVKHETNLQESDDNTQTDELENGVYADSLLPCYDERSPIICYLPTTTTLSAEQVGVQHRAYESLANNLGASHKELENIQAMKNAKRGIVTGEKYPHINAKDNVWRNEKPNVMPDKDDSSEQHILDRYDNAGDFVTICYLHASIFLGSTPNAFM